MFFCSGFKEPSAVQADIFGFPHGADFQFCDFSGFCVKQTDFIFNSIRLYFHRN